MPDAKALENIYTGEIRRTANLLKYKFKKYDPDTTGIVTLDQFK